MSEHLSELEIYEIAADADPPAGRSDHFAECAACSAKVASTRRLLAGVEELDPAVRAPAGLDAALQSRVAHLGRRRRGGVVARRWLARAAIAASFFAAGALSRTWVDSGPGAAADRTVSVSPAIAVQRAGTDYVAAVGRLVADSSQLSAADLSTAREVALAALSGAAYELTLLRADDPQAAEIHRLAKRAWSEPALRGGQ